MICGDGLQRSKLERQLKNQNCDEAWQTTGFLTPEEVRKALKIADILILPSRIEMLGSVLLEAMAAGVPAVAYEVGGVGSVGGPENAIKLVQPENRSLFIETILELLADPEQRNELAERGKEESRRFRSPRSRKRLFVAMRKF